MTKDNPIISAWATSTVGVRAARDSSAIARTAKPIRDEVTGEFPAGTGIIIDHGNRAGNIVEIERARAREAELDESGKAVGTGKTGVGKPSEKVTTTVRMPFFFIQELHMTPCQAALEAVGITTETSPMAKGRTRIRSREAVEAVAETDTIDRGGPRQRERESGTVRNGRLRTALSTRAL